MKFDGRYLIFEQYTNRKEPQFSSNIFQTTSINLNNFIAVHAPTTTVVVILVLMSPSEFRYF